MARAGQYTKLSLDRWAQLIGLNPLHFNGVYDPNRPTSPCEQPWLQYSWQDADRVGREEIAYAIAQAEDSIENYLTYRLLPDWETDEWHPTVRPFRPELINLNSMDVRGFGQNIQTDWGHLISGGIRAQTLIEADATITYTDPDGDGYFERATVTVTVTAGQNPAEVRVYFPASNSIVTAGGDDWKIRPIKVVISGTTATITFARHQAVLPEAYEDFTPPSDDSHMRGVDGLENANFLAEVDVYRLYNDPQTQATLMWEPLGTCECGSSDCDVCSYTVQTACLLARGDLRPGLVVYHPASWDAATLSFTSQPYSVSRQPDVIRLYYYAGHRNKHLIYPTIQMDPQLERAVAYMAAGLLDRPICECSNVRAFVQHWQEIAKSSQGGVEAGTPENTPFGGTNGALFAWKIVNQEGRRIARSDHI